MSSKHVFLKRFVIGERTICRTSDKSIIHTSSCRVFPYSIHFLQVQAIALHRRQDLSKTVL